MIKNLLLGGILVLWGSLPALGADVTCPGEGQIKSASTDINSEITFTNNSGKTRQIFWIDFEGVRVQYGNIAPGATHVQPTFLGHAWLIANQDADCLGLYFAESANRSVSLTAAEGSAPAPVTGIPPRRNRQPVGGNPPPSGQQPAAVDDSPCDANEYWNKSRNLCINTVTKRRRKPDALPANPGGATIRPMRCRPGFVQKGNRCVRQTGAVIPPASPRPQPVRQTIPQGPANNFDADNEENRPDDLCGPGFTDIGGGCISNSLLKQN